MTTRRATARTLEENFANVWVPLQGNHVRQQDNLDPLKDNQAPKGGQAPGIPPHMIDGDIRSFVTLPQDMTTQSQAAATQSQVMIV